MAHETESDAELVARARRGERAAISAIYDRYASELYRKVLLPRCGDVDQAHDALAETFRSVLTSLADYAPHPAGLWPWLARIAVSKAMDAHRARARKARALASFAELVIPVIGESPALDDATAARERSDLERAVRDTLTSLRPRYREAIELRFFEELPRDACAVRLDITLGNFDVTLLRALRAFREAWESRLRKEDAP